MLLVKMLSKRLFFDINTHGIVEIRMQIVESTLYIISRGL